MSDPRLSIIPAAAVTDHDAWALEVLAQRRDIAPEPTVADVGYDTRAVMALAERFGGRCWYCGCELAAPIGAGVEANTATRDHVVPRSKGGSNHPGNLVAACRRCNNDKRAKSLEEYRAALSQRRDGANVLFYGEQNK